MKPYVICYRGVAHPWLCDNLNHLNTRHYMAFFDDAMQHFFSILGYEKAEGFGWVDVRHEIDYKDEISPGSLIHVDTALIRVGSKSITYYQRLLLTDEMKVAATNKATTVLFDLSSRTAVAAPEIIRTNGEPYTVKEV